jgi:phenol/toluene 2-monooxygenase (NADH) P2/A2
MSVTAEPRPVGVDLQENEENRALVEAIEADNDDLNIRHMPGMIRLTKNGRLVINQASVEQRLGRPWETHEFQMAIISYFGEFVEWDDDQIVIAWKH